MPDYEIDAARKKVVVRIYGNEINKRYTDLLKTNNTPSLWDCISLDAVQKGRLINEDAAKNLLCRGLIPSLAIADTFIGHRRYLRWLSQIPSIANEDACDRSVSHQLYHLYHFSVSEFAQFAFAQFAQ